LAPGDDHAQARERGANEHDRGAKKPSGADPGGQEGAAMAGVEQPRGEQGGPSGPEPTRYGDWEKGGRCFDF
jgi:hypothetical protein